MDSSIMCYHISDHSAYIGVVGWAGGEPWSGSSRLKMREEVGPSNGLR